jgi:raffinose/stachyose/melibiose transport system substrate-binding protein
MLLMTRPRRHGAGRGRWSAVALVVVACAVAAPAAADRVALVIGNGSYTGISPLPNPRNDATALGATLAGIGFDVDVVIDGDLATLIGALDGFADRAAGAEVALVFYAGHGMQLDGTNYLLPTDIVLRSRSDLPGAAVAMDDVFAAFAEAAPEAAVLILDACRDNPFVDAIGTGQGLASGTPASAGVARPSAAGTIIAFSAAPGAVASDGRTGNSPYTTALLQWIDRPGIELGTMFRRVRGTVLELTGEEQVPWVEESLVQDIFLNPAPPPPPPSDGGRMEVALLESARGFDDAIERGAAQTFYDRYLIDASATPRDAMDDDERMVRAGLIWLSIRDSDDPAVLRQFVDVFPEVSFSRLAQARLAELAAAPPDTGSGSQAWLDDLPPVPPRPRAQAGDVGAPADLPGTGADATAPRPPSQLSEAETDAPPGPGGTTAPPSPAMSEAELALDADEYEAAQVLLAEAGFYGGPIDGDYGPGTRGGIARLQAETGLPQTGHLTVETLRQLVARAAPVVLSRAAAEPRHDAIHALAAVAARGPGAEPEVVRVGALARNDRVHAYWREVADAFEADNPGTLIEITHRPDWQYQRELMAILGAEEPPDLIYTWSGGHLDALREAGFARDLTEEMGDGWAFGFKPGALRTYTHEGRVYGAPMHLSLMSLYANGPVLDQAGIDVGTLETWDGFLDAVERLRARGIPPLAVGGGEIWPYSVYFDQLAQRLVGREAVLTALAGEGEGFDGPAFREAREAFETLVSLGPFQPDHASMDDGEATEMVAGGEAAMIVTGSWRLEKMFWSWEGGPEAMDRELVQLPFPALPGAPQQSITIGGADGFAVSAEAPDIAVDFLRRLTAIDVQERMAELAYDIPSVSGADLAIEDSFLGDVTKQVLVSDHHRLYLGQQLGPEAGGIFDRGMADVVAGRSDIDVVLGRVDAAIADRQAAR